MELAFLESTKFGSFRKPKQKLNYYCPSKSCLTMGDIFDVPIPSTDDGAEVTLEFQLAKYEMVCWGNRIPNNFLTGKEWYMLVDYYNLVPGREDGLQYHVGYKLVQSRALVNDDRRFYHRVDIVHTVDNFYLGINPRGLCGYDDSEPELVLIGRIRSSRVYQPIGPVRFWLNSKDFYWQLLQTASHFRGPLLCCGSKFCGPCSARFNIKERFDDNGLQEIGLEGRVVRDLGHPEDGQTVNPHEGIVVNDRISAVNHDVDAYDIV